jgi:DNA-directed RNA polymerase specialized sigma24 family protein
MRRALFSHLFAVQSDGRLLALARKGSDLAFEALARRHCRSLLIYCRRLPLPDARAQGVVQRALLDGWAALREGAEVEDPRTWLLGLVRTAAVEAVRDAAAPGAAPAGRPGDGVFARPAPVEPKPGEAVGEERTGGLLALGEQAAQPAGASAEPAVRGALAGIAALPPLQREVIVRADLLGQPSGRVAGELGIADGAVRRLLLKARASLRATTDALIPPPLLGLLAGGGSGAPTPERLTELLAGGPAAGLGGLLVKGGVAAVTVGVVAGAAIVHTPRSPRPRRTPAAHAAVEIRGAPPSAQGAARGEYAAVLRPRSSRPRRSPAGTSSPTRAPTRPPASPTPGALGGRSPAPASHSHLGAPRPAAVPQSPAAPGSPKRDSGQPGPASGGSSDGGTKGGGSGGPGPVGSAAGAGSGSGGGGSGGAPKGGGQGGGAPGGSGSGAGGPGQGDPGAGSGGGPPPGGLVGATVQGVGGLVEGASKIISH